MKWGLIAIPVIVMLSVGWWNVAVVQTGCIVNSPVSNCNTDVSQSVFSNSLSWLMGGLTPSGPPSPAATACGNWGGYFPFTNTCVPIPTIQQLGYSIQQTFASGNGGSILFGIVGFAMIMFAIFGNAKVLDTGLNLTDSNTRLLIAMGVGYMVWAGLTNFTGTIMYEIPFGFGYMLMAALTIIYSIGVYDLGRTFT